MTPEPPPRNPGTSTTSARPEWPEWSHWISALDQKIRTGQVRQARRELELRLQEPVERPFLSEVAALCRRTGLAERSVKLLAPWVRPNVRTVVQATDAEKGEYAAALIQIGADLEGTRLLESVNPQHFPRALFFRALALFSRWDYLPAIPLLERYVSIPTLTPYDRLIGEVNLTAAQVACDQNAPRLPELIARTHEQGLHLLHTNLLEIQAQSLITQGRTEEAADALNRASSFLREIGQTDALFLKKWKAVLERDERALLRVRKEAEIARHWETVRDCDFHLGRKLEHLYFGTPFEAFRERIQTHHRFVPPEHLDWTLGKRGASRTPLIDPQHCPGLKPGQILQRLLLALARDFYRPMRLPALHSALFPDRHYNPTSSPTVIHQAIRRFRAWAEEQEIAIRIREHAGTYRLEGEVTLRLTRQPASTNGATARLGSFLETLRAQSSAPEQFTHIDAMKWSGLSSRSTHRLLQVALTSGLLARTGAGKGTRYRLL